MLDLDIGIPTWNSSLFLECCLQQIKRTCQHLRYRITIIDNASTDDTCRIARSHGCRLWVKRQSMPDALNQLTKRSSARHTLFLHADTVLLHPDWYALTSARLEASTALVSPQDIGCGPYSRPRGIGKPESSFMLFDTRRLHQLYKRRWVRRLRLPFPQRYVDFYSGSVTHHIPRELQGKGYRWHAMQVHLSPQEPEPVFHPDRRHGCCWSESLARLRYGLGNFYSVDGVVTHYHNWYDRILGEHHEADAPRGDGIPAAYIAERTRVFLRDYANGAIQIPSPLSAEQPPQEIPYLAPLPAA